MRTIRILVINLGHALVEIPNREEPLRLYNSNNRIQDTIHALVSPSPGLNYSWEYTIEGHPLDLDEDTVTIDPDCLQEVI